jgi:hypothetical protein
LLLLLLLHTSTASLTCRRRLLLNQTVNWLPDDVNVTIDGDGDSVRDGALCDRSAPQNFATTGDLGVVSLPS